MSKTGPIIIVEDNPDDLDVIVSGLKDIGVNNPIVSFDAALKAMAYLLETSDQPFVILCDIRMKEMNGLQFRDTINDNEYLRKKSIPFVFLTAAVSQEIVDVAYDLTVQGFMEKPKSYEELKDVLREIVSYWHRCWHPNSF